MTIKAEDMLSFHCPRWGELPGFDLYIDQVIGFLNESLAVFAQSGEPMITSSMVNNYVKQGILHAPVKKKYSREHLAKLVVICVGKRMFSLWQIGDSIAAMMRVFEVCDGYDIFCNEVEYAVRSAVSPTDFPPKTLEDADTREIASMRALAGAFAHIALFDRLVAVRRAEEAGQIP